VFISKNYINITAKVFTVIILASFFISFKIQSATAQSDCVNLRGMNTSVRLVNRCSIDVNVAACCAGEGVLGNCQNNQFEILNIKSNTNQNIGRCEGFVYWNYCESPKTLVGLSWRSGAGIRGRCLDPQETVVPFQETRVIACEDVGKTTGTYINEFVGSAGKRCLYRLGGNAYWLEISPDEACPAKIECG